ncbi:type I-G CRISPR-associated helicase/endonuclease Cas3g [Roseiconus lacunae]|uniref:type I-G CRISPR-associated helicase/endonuclease Cas3g n=1 Tax=Roseiconus lacunae TaxID=2605694 RepID=UPI001E362DB6|nr:type I-U CRISPR-associated helicase/endonuclease Cas3 [Roseiconus lacunae]MCD0462128.1 type I-U CRISPR-associated helicase/endonuclease Cas3 [Roseiconus lacunae]
MNFDPLTPDDFTGFFQTVHGYPPYQWQIQLVRTVHERGWPDQLALPTGSGKTSVLDIALFSLALQAEREHLQRTTATRIFFVVDRRIVVDAAARLAGQLASDIHLKHPEAVVRNVAARLQSLSMRDGRAVSSGENIVATHVLRGGFYRTNAWAVSATQPTIVTATVDQVGSRLLFRGYGISPAARSLQAGLIGNDSLIVIDESHISRPFAECARSVTEYQHREQKRRLVSITRPLKVVELSATMAPPPKVSSDALEEPPTLPPIRQLEQMRFDLKSERQINPTSPAVLRYEIAKPVTLSVAEKAKGKRWSEGLVKDLDKRVRDHLADQTDSIAVVVNRIRTAIDLFQQLRSGKQAVDADVELMIGRMRPYDRDRIAERLRLRLETSRKELSGERPIVVVATQCLEVGADLDFQRMISEAASLDALRQRFGRLNRSARQPDSCGEVVVRADQQVVSSKLGSIAGSKSSANDPVYGDSLARTFDWLRSIARDDQVDFGSQAMDRHFADWIDQNAAGRHSEDATRLLAGAAEQAVLLPAHLKMLVQTTVDPGIHPDPDVSVFLHGMTDRPVDVNVCWRSDLFRLEPVSAASESAATGDKDGRTFRAIPFTDGDLVAAVTQCPPTSPECMAVPIKSVSKWMRGQSGIDENLADTAASIDDGDEEEPLRTIIGVIYRGPDESIVCHHPRDLRPGDTLVLPTIAGGWNDFGYLPTSPSIDEFDPNALTSQQVESLIRVDVADEASLLARWKIQLRMMPALQVLDDRLSYWLRKIDSGEENCVPAEWLDNLISKRIERCDPSFQPILRQISFGEIDPVMLEGSGEFRLRLRDGNAGFVIQGRERLTWAQAQAIESGDGNHREIEWVETSGCSRAIKLVDHSAAVSERASKISKAVGLPENLQVALGRFGWLHDLGKGDARFQTMLSGLPGRIGWLRGKPLAKSGRFDESSAVRQRLREQADLPRGFRHERTSVLVAEQLGIETDPLVLYLIAVHHGRARPWYPPVGDTLPPTVTKDVIDELELVPSVDSVTEESAGDLRIADRFWRTQDAFGFWGSAWLETIARLADQQVSREEATAVNTLTGPSFSPPTNAIRSSDDRVTLHEITLDGLDGGNTLAYLAALGTLVLIDQACRKSGIDRPQFSWSVRNAAYRPSLWLPAAQATREWIIDTLGQMLDQPFTGPRRWLDHGYEKGQTEWPKGSGKVNPNPAWIRLVADATRRHFVVVPDSDSSNCDWVSAIGSEVSQRRSNKDREIDYSHLYLTRGSGHQRMFEIARAIRDQTELHHLREALFETWSYTDMGRGLSLRFDAAEDRPYAMRWLNPSSDPIQTVRGANALAFEALVCFPTAVVRHELMTTGFHRIPRRGTHWYWPLWRSPASLDVVGSLLQIDLRLVSARLKSEVHGNAMASFVDRCGIEAIYQTERKVNDKFFNFAPAVALR